MKKKFFIFFLAINVISIILFAQAILILISPGIKYSKPEDAVNNYWLAMNAQNFAKAAISFSDIRFIDAFYASKGMMPFCQKISEIYFIEKTMLNDTLVHLLYRVKFGDNNSDFITGDLMIYTKNFGWRILQPMSNPPE